MKKFINLISITLVLCGLFTVTAGAVNTSSDTLPSSGYEVVSREVVNLPAPTGTTIEQTTTIYENGFSSVETFAVTKVNSILTRAEPGAYDYHVTYSNVFKTTTLSDPFAYMSLNGYFSGAVDSDGNRITRVIDASTSGFTYNPTNQREEAFIEVASDGVAKDPKATVTAEMGVNTAAGAKALNLTVTCDYNGNTTKRAYWF